MANNLRGSEIVEFLARSGWGDASRTALNEDASTRRYERLRRRLETAMLMDAPRLESPPCPPGADDEERLRLGWNATSRLAASRVEAFAAVAGHLVALGLSAPRVLDVDIPRGLALLEDLGDDLFARAIEQGADETALYAAAGETLAAVHRAAAPFTLPYRGGEWPILSFDHLALSANVDLFVDWMPKRDLDIRINEQTRLRWERVRENLIAKSEDFPRALMLRDTHAENLIWLPQRNGTARVGLLDFQDALMGPAPYDLVSLLQDARVDVPEQDELTLLTRYVKARRAADPDFDHGQFIKHYVTLAAQRASKILGIFARLDLRDGKPQYLRHMPRVWGYLQRSLGHPALVTLAAWYRDNVPSLKTI